MFLQNRGENEREREREREKERENYNFPEIRIASQIYFLAHAITFEIKRKKIVKIKSHCVSFNVLLQFYNAC